MAAIIFKQSFRYEWTIGGKYDFYDYLTRPEAFNSKAHKTKDDIYYDYLEYMRNDEKSYGAFDAEKDLLNQDDLERYRSYEVVSQLQGCPKYLGVLSFENEFLKENGIMRADGSLRHDKLREYARLSMAALIEKSNKLNADNVYWTAAIHENTDNIHIHYQLCEYNRLEDRKKKYKDKDALELKAFDAIKSKMANQICPRTEEKIKITTLLRGLANNEIPNSFSEINVEKKIFELYKTLPPLSSVPSDKDWNYNSKKMKDYKSSVDTVVKNIIQSDKNLSAQFKEFEDELYTYDQYNLYLYGKRKNMPENDREFVRNRLNDFYSRAGNTLLKYMKQLDLSDEDRLFKSTQQMRPHLSEKRKPEVSSEYFELEKYEPTVDDIAFLNEDLFSDDIPENMMPHLSEERIPETYNEFPTPEIYEPNADDFSFLNDDYSDGIPDDIEPYLSEKEKTVELDIKWSEEYKKAMSYLYGKNDKEQPIEKDITSAAEILKSEDNKGNILATFELGKIYSNELIKDDNGKILGKQYYQKAFKGFKDLLELTDNEISLSTGNAREQKSLKWRSNYLNYRIGKMYDKKLGVEQNYEEARKHYEAAPNNKYANYALGCIHKYGNGTEINLEKAFDCFKRSSGSKGGMPYADYALGYAYANGEGCVRDEDMSQKYYAASLDKFKKMYSKNKDENLSYKIGYMYFNGLGTDVNISDAEKYFTASAEMNNPRADYMLGKIRMENKKYAEAEQYFQKAAKKDNFLAKYSLGKLYLQDDNLNVNKAENFFKAAAGHKDDKQLLCEYSLGKLYMSDDKKNLDEAEGLLLLSAGKKNSFAQYTLGKLYQTDEKLDLDKAEEFLKLSAEQDDKSGLGEYGLGKLYMRDEKKNLDEAERLLLLSAGKKNSFAQYTLGKLYQTDEKLDLDKAEEFLKLSAEQDDKSGLGKYGLGKLYMCDEKKNLDEAERLLLLSAGKKNSFAQYTLGKLYQTDEKFDLDKAEEFLKLSAEQKNELAQYGLGKLYMHDEKLNLDQAEHYLELAAKKNNQGAQYSLGILYMHEKKINLRQAEHFLLQSAEQGGEFSQYAHYKLGVLYQTPELNDPEKAEQHFLSSSGFENSYAQLALGIMKYRSGNKQEANKWLRRSISNGNEFAEEILKNINRVGSSGTSVRKTKKFDRPKAHYISYQLRSVANNLRYEYEKHLQEMKREYEHDQQQNSLSNEYDYIDISRR